MKLYPTLLASALSLQLSTALAHGDEDHGAVQPLPASTQRLPAAEAHSPDFELYAQLEGDRLTVYLDRYSDNQPIAGASIEVESADFKAPLQPLSAGTYQAPAEALNHPGEHNLLFTVLAGEQSDFLDAVLTVSPAAAAGPSALARPGWWLAAALAVLAAAAWLLQRRRRPGSINQGAAR
ncbi:hypothetical protein [Pseudomonas sp. N040]|uniref:hypothetical protein n=1 Tax=Pseudomonas sp. N040 TaxID=2785325 RepID=UPI0018A26D9F|nr:hypothetical protein [Pseudomonas sp. N040]MBF7731703.1 hypothetical protein [Pseudomonas sp. N040]MBW7015347.1 hypothetical protein [Pseudomonas sp. N040]